MNRYIGPAAASIVAVAVLVACGGSQHEPTEVASTAYVDTPPVIFNKGDQTQLPVVPPIAEPELGKFTIAGTIVGYVGSDLMLKNNGEEITIAKNAETFQFTLPVNENTSYDVTVSSQPDLPTQACKVSAGSGVARGTVTNVIVNCATDAKFAYLAKLSGNIERFAYDEGVINFGESLGKTQLIGLPAATNLGMAKHPYKSMIYSLQTGTNEISSFLVDEKTGELRISSMKSTPAIADTDDAKINSIGARLIAHPNGKMLYSFDASHIYAHALNEGGQPISTTVIDGPVGMKIYEAVLNPGGDGLFVHGYMGREIDVYPVDLASGNLGVALPRATPWAVTRITFQSDGKNLFAVHELGRASYAVDSSFTLKVEQAVADGVMGEVVSDPNGKFVFLVAASSPQPGAVVSGYREYVKDSITGNWNYVYIAKPVANPAYNVAAIDPLGKYVYMFGDEKVLGLHTGSALTGSTPTEITDVKSGRALLLY